MSPDSLISALQCEDVCDDCSHREERQCLELRVAAAQVIADQQAEIKELKAENERIRNNSVSDTVFKEFVEDER